MTFLKLVFEKRKIGAQETPQSFFDHLLGNSGRSNAFLLESGHSNKRDQDDRSNQSARYSYLGYDPFLICESDKNGVRVFKKRDFGEMSKSTVEQRVEGHPIQILQTFMKQFRYSGKTPVPFFGGACGYFSYDFGATLMNTGQQVFDDTHLPEFVFSFFDKIVAFDHETSEVYFLAIAETDLKAQQKMLMLKGALDKPPGLVSAGSVGAIQSNLSKAQYVEKISKIKQLLHDGETYQVNFSQRFSGDCTLDAWKIYKNLAKINPAPFSCYFDFDDFQIMSSSPELLLRKRGNMLETMPIKGTVARGKNEDEDKIQIDVLLASEKDKAELAMIVDLERNDLGAVCDFGSVRVAAHREIEKYAHVIHTVSKVEGRLGRGKDFFDAFQALFPGGSITGCPKRRTMEIIDKLEDFKRGIYTGSAGFVSFAGDGDLNILIRTMLKKDKKVYFHAGGGIVIDSDAKKEYQETLDKVEALRKVLEN